MQKLVSCVLLGWSWCCVSCDLKTCHVLQEDSFGDGNANDELSVALQAKQEVYDGSMTFAGEDCNKPYQACIGITGCGWSIEDKKCISFTPNKIKYPAHKAKDALVSVVDGVNSPAPNCNFPYQKCIQTDGCGWSIQQRKCIVFSTSARSSNKQSVRSSNEQSVDLVQSSDKRMISKAKFESIRQKIRQLQDKVNRKKIAAKEKKVVHMSRRRRRAGQYYNRFNPDHPSCDWKAQKLQIMGGGTISISSHSRRGKGTRRRSTDCLWTSRHFDLRGGGEATVAIRRFEGLAAPRRRLIEQFARRRRSPKKVKKQNKKKNAKTASRRRCPKYEREVVYHKDTGNVTMSFNVRRRSGCPKHVAR